MAILEYQLRAVGEQDVARALMSVERRLVAHQARVNRTLSLGGGSIRQRAQTPQQASRAIVQSQQSIFKSFDQGQRKIFESTRAYERTSLREKLRGIERAKKEEISKIRAVARADLNERRAANRTFRRAIGTGAGNAVGKLAAVGKAGAGMIGVGGSVLAASAVSESLKLDEMTRRLSIAGRGAGEKGVDPESLRKQMVSTGIETGIAPEALAGAASTYVAKTGDLDTATKNLKNFAIVAQATGSSVEDVASTAADLAQKFDIKSAKDMGDALAVLAFQGKKGAFELKDMASEFPEMAAAAQRAGLKGLGGMRTLGGLAQIARQSTGSGAEASTAVQMMMTQLTKKSGELKSGKALGGKSVNVFQGGDATKGARDLPTVLSEIISKSHGNMTQLSKLFDVRGIRAVSPMIQAYHDASDKAGGGAKGEAAGKKAVLDMIKDASNATGEFADVQKDAADAMKATSVQLDIAMMQLKQVFAEELMPAVREFAPRLKELGPPARFVMEEMLGLARFLGNNPLAGLGLLFAAEITKEIAAAQLAQLLQGGVLTPLGMLGVAAGALGLSLMAAKAYVDSIYAKAKGNVEAAAASGDEIRKKAGAELDAQGYLSPETRKQLEGLQATESGTLEKSGAVFKEGALDTAGRAYQQWFGGGAHNLDEAATLQTAGGNEKYVSGAIQTKGLLNADNAAASDPAIQRLKELAAAAAKATTAMNAVGGGPNTPPNRGNGPSPVKG